MNKKPAKVTLITQSFIDAIRIRRSELNISAEELSKEIAPFEGDSLVGQIENVFKSAKYTPTTLKKALNFLKMKTEDIVPHQLLADDELHDKTKIPILKGMSIRAALNSLLEEGYFDEGKNRSEITLYYNTFFSFEMHKKDSDFSAQLEDMYNEGRLLKIGPNKESGEKLIKFIVNKKYNEKK